MGRLGFYFDGTQCTGCRTCQVACKDKNRLEVGTNFREVCSFESGSYPDARIYHYSGACNHCENPACIAVCASGAMYKAEDGTVICDTEMCGGCGACVEACPYKAPKMLDNGKVGKCDACAYLRAKGQNPACVDSCLMRCLEFGDLEELAAKHEGEELVCALPFLPDPDITTPSLLINPKESSLAEDFRQVSI